MSPTRSCGCGHSRYGVGIRQGRVYTWWRPISAYDGEPSSEAEMALTNTIYLQREDALREQGIFH